MARPALRSPLDHEIARLAVPAFGALVAEPLFLLADSAIVGRLGTAPLAGLGVAGTALATLVNLCVFLAYGTTSAVARRLGAGDRPGALEQGVHGLWLGAGLGCVLLLVGLPAAPAVVHLLGASETVTPYAVTYLQVSLFGLPSMLLVLAATGLLRGLQDTRTPLYVAAVGSAVNVALNVVFVLVLGWGVAGSALGTVLVQTASAGVYLGVLLPVARRHGASLRPDTAGLRGAVGVAAHLFVRTVELRAVLVVATAVAARLGDAAVAAHQVAFAVWSLLALALDAVAIAGQAMTGRYLGAGDAPAARAATRRMVGWGVALGLVLGVAVFAVHGVLPALFTADPHVRDLLGSVLVVVALQQPLNGVVFALDGVLIGAGDTRYLAVAGAVTALVFIAGAAVVLATTTGVTGLWWALTAFMVARFVTLTWRERGERWLVLGAAR